MKQCTLLFLVCIGVFLTGQAGIVFLMRGDVLPVAVHEYTTLTGRVQSVDETTQSLLFTRSTSGVQPNPIRLYFPDHLKIAEQVYLTHNGIIYAEDRMRERKIEDIRPEEEVTVQFSPTHSRFEIVSLRLTTPLLVEK